MSRPKTGTLVAISIAIVVCLPNFLYPFFEDASLYAVIGRLMGDDILPYRDALDQKPPAIYWVTYLTDLLLGRSSIASRVAELGAILLMAVACAKIAADVTRAAALPIGIVVTAALSGGLFWATAERGQVEWYQAAVTAWGAYFAVASLRSARHKHLILCGAFLGLACWFKPQGALTGVAIGAVLVARPAIAKRWREAWRATRLIGAGVVIASVPFLFWMLVTGILDDFAQMMFVYNTEYLQHSASPTIGEAMDKATTWPWLEGRTMWVFRVLTGAGIVAFLVPGDRRKDRIFSGAIVLLWFAASFGQFLSGRYLFRYHLVILLPSMAVLLTCGIMELWRLGQQLTADQLRQSVRKLLAATAVLLLIVVVFDNRKYVFEWKWFARWVASDTTTEETYNIFGRRLQYYSYNTQRRAADYVREQTKPGDTVQVIGRGGTFYLYVDRHPASRYLVTNGVFDGRRAMHDFHLDRLLSDLERNKPAFILIRHDDKFPWFGLPASAQQVNEEPRMIELLRRDYKPVGLWENSAFMFKRRSAAGVAQ